MDFSRILAGGKRDEVTGCVEWQGCTQANGYGRVRFMDRTRYVHRVAYEVFKGDIPKGMDVCHTCDNRKCFNPDHLFVGTRLDNMKDCASKGRLSRGIKHSKCIVNKSKKLSYDEAQIIRNAACNGMKTRTLANVFQIDISMVRLIKKNMVWKETENG